MAITGLLPEAKCALGFGHSEGTFSHGLEGRCLGFGHFVGSNNAGIAHPPATFRLLVRIISSGLSPKGFGKLAQGTALGLDQEL